MTLSSLPMWKVYVKPQIGRVQITLYSQSGAKLESTVTPTETQTFKLDNRIKFTVTTDADINDIKSIGITWQPEGHSVGDSLMIRNFFLRQPNGEDQLRYNFCRWQPSRGVKPGQEFIYKLGPNCTVG